MEAPVNYVNSIPNDLGLKKNASLNLDSGDSRLARTLNAPFKRKTRKRLGARVHPNTLPEIQEEIERIDREKSNETIDLIKKALNNHFVFKSLDASQM